MAALQPTLIPDSPPPPPPFDGPKPAPAPSLEEIRKNLAEFRLKSGPPPPSAPPTLSFQDLFKNNSPNNAGGNATAPSDKRDALSFDSIRESFRKFRSPHPGRDGLPPQNAFRGMQFDNFRDRISPKRESTILGEVDRLPESIFSKEGKKEGGADGEPKGMKTEFLRMYSYEELGEKLRRLRPEAAAKGGDKWFSLKELNERLVMLREFEEKEVDSRMGGVMFRDIRDSLVRLREVDINKKTAINRLSILTSFTGQVTPPFMLKPPQEQLLEKYSHPDHLSSAEKIKLELKKVRDEFKMSENDCGSTRVQVAQLTTKIKHLSSALHKKDKHSRKGLQEMVQRRKKLLKYLRRTDWDSYCMTLSKLGLRDVPEYKAPGYKT